MPAAPGASLAEDRGAAVVQSHEHRNDDEQRRKYQKRRNGEQEVKEALATNHVEGSLRRRSRMR
jgi:hypothetical protein